MTVEAKVEEALLGAIERRLTEISERQHALAVENARLLEQITPLRLGVVVPEASVVQLRARGDHAPRSGRSPGHRAAIAEASPQSSRAPPLDRRSVAPGVGLTRRRRDANCPTE
jgi:hypothetical protein